MAMALDSLPKTPEDAYYEIFSRIDRRGNNAKERVYKILSWIFHAVRPLTIDELREVLAVELDDTYLERDYMFPSEFIVESCQSLVMHDRETGIVRFTHYTIQQFIESTCRPQLLLIVDIAKTCLTYLNFQVFEEGRCPDPEALSLRMEEYKFAGYAAQYWSVHTRGEAEKDSSVQSKVMELITSAPKKSAVMQISLKLGGSLFGEPETGGPLTIAASYGLAGICRIILEERAPSSYRKHVEDWFDRKPDERDDSGMTALHLAAYHGHLEVVQVLLEFHAEVNIVDNRCRTALGYAAERGWTEIVKLLLQANADMRLERGGTTLELAALLGKADVVLLLLDSEAEITMVERQRAIIDATERGYFEIAKSLAGDDSDINLVQNTAGRNLLQIAAMNGEKEIVKWLLGRKFNIENEDVWGNQALSLAAGAGMNEIVSLLLEAKSNISATNKRGNTALHVAALGNHASVVQLLLDADADISLLNKDGFTPLHAAAACRGEDYVRFFATMGLLTDAGADINVQSTKGLTPLHVAAELGCLETASYLISEGADTTVRDQHGRLALDLAARRGHMALIELMRAPDAKVSLISRDANSDYLRQAVFGGHHEIVKVLVETNPDAAKRCDEEGYTELHIAAGKGFEEVVGILLHAGADIECTDY